MSDPLGFEILYEQAGCLVVSKPPGLLTQAPPGIDSLEMRVKTYLGGSDSPGSVYLGVPHRLDRPATGVIVLGKDLRATRNLVRSSRIAVSTRSIGPVSKVTSRQKPVAGRISCTRSPANHGRRWSESAIPRAAMRRCTIGC